MWSPAFSLSNFPIMHHGYPLKTHKVESCVGAAKPAQYTYPQGKLLHKFISIFFSSFANTHACLNKPPGGYSSRRHPFLPSLSFLFCFGFWGLTQGFFTGLH
jgi:hypothetical protein